jgi:serine/threonine protein kinase
VTTPSTDGFTSSADEEELPVELHADPDRRFGKYTLAYRIASGGMATVYLGREHGPHGFDRPVAIKRIHPHLQGRRAFVDMFLDEARIAARINHPNVCTVLDFGEAEHTYYIALEYLVGVALHRLIAEVARDEDRLRSPKWYALAARIIADAAEGLHAAHELKDGKGEPLHVVHRDVSPQNLFVTFDGVVKVVDFGVARARARIHQTATGTVKGKLAYMAPEHALGDAIDRRADVWSLGVCLWECLSGRRLFKRKNEMEVILAICEGSIPRLSSLVPDIPPMLDEIVVQALERDVDLRFPTTRALGMALQTFMKSQPEATGLAELSEWMASLFARERSERLEMLSTALYEDESRARPRAADEGHHTVSLLEVAEAPTQAFDTGSLSSPMMDVPTDATPERPWKWMVAGAGALVFLIALGVVLGFAVGSGANDEVVERAGARAEAEAGAGSERDTETGTGTETETDTDTDTDTDTVTGTELEVATGSPSLERGRGQGRGDPASQPDTELEVSTGSPSLERGRGQGRGDPASQPDTELEVSAGSPSLERGRGQGRGDPASQMRAPAMTEPTRAREAASGEVVVVAINGWADVYSNGRRVGRTPSRVRLPAGRATLVLQPFGGPASLRRSVNVRANEETRLVVDVR